MAQRDPDYWKRYRATVKPRKERAEYQRGLAEGIERAGNLMRSLFGDRSITGHDAASAITKTLGITKRA
jgi:hypothetical protein